MLMLQKSGCSNQLRLIVLLSHWFAGSKMSKLHSRCGGCLGFLNHQPCYYSSFNVETRAYLQLIFLHQYSKQFKRRYPPKIWHGSPENGWLEDSFPFKGRLPGRCELLVLGSVPQKRGQPRLQLLGTKTPDQPTTLVSPQPSHMETSNQFHQSCLCLAILLMLQKLRRENQLRLGVYHIIYRDLYISGGCLRFQLSPVSQAFKIPDSLNQNPSGKYLLKRCTV